jgi:hypothetical protein
MTKRISPYILLAGLVGLSLLGWWIGRQVAGVTGFPLDDAWIHQTYARSLAQGDGWSFTPGEPSAGATAPFWVLLLIPGYWFGLAPFGWVIFLAVVQLWTVGALGFTTWKMLGLGHKSWGLACSALLVLEWHLIWAALSGMETLLYGLISLAVITILLTMSSKSEEKLTGWLALGALVGLAVWVRPEAVTLLAPIGVSVLLTTDKPLKTRLSHLLITGLGFSVMFGLYLGFNRWLAGTWWPNTFYAKQAEYSSLQAVPLLTRLLTQFSPLMAGVLFALLPGFIFNIYLSFKQRSWISLSAAAWVLGHVTMYAIRLPVIYQHGRYVIPVVPLFVLLGFVGTYQLISGLQAQRIKWLTSRLWGGIIISFLGLFWFLGIQSYLEDVSMIDGEMVITANWLVANTAEDDLIAAHDIGAIGYFSQRPIVDLAGLVSPDVISFIRDENSLLQYLDQLCPKYLVSFPDWYQLLPEKGEPVFQTNTQITRDSDRENMVIYRWVGDGNCP